MPTHATFEFIFFMLISYEYIVQLICLAIFDPQAPSQETKGPRRRKLLTLYKLYDHSPIRPV
jgi:hypothetical protein